MAILWIGCLAYFSLGRILPHAGAGTTSHRLEHIAAFAVLGLLLLPLSRNRIQEWMVVLVILGIAAALEEGQHKFFRNVGFEWWDVRDDAIGLLLVWLVVRSARRQFKEKLI